MAKLNKICTIVHANLRGALCAVFFFPRMISQAQACLKKSSAVVNFVFFSKIKLLKIKVAIRVVSLGLRGTGCINLIAEILL